MIDLAREVGTDERACHLAMFVLVDDARKLDAPESTLLQDFATYLMNRRLVLLAKGKA